jgi:glycosyltransferase involved in cell wall biosynthesis
MNRNAIGGLASIIIPCCNQLEFTRQCITALKSHTRQPWELVVIDNGSTDGTGAYLSGVKDAAAVIVTVIANTANRGFPAAINQGLQQARGEYLVLLNNDVVVTDAWLDQLTALTTAKNAGEQNGLTAKDAKSAKKVRHSNGTGNFADETLIGLGDAGKVAESPVLTLVQEVSELGTNAVSDEQFTLRSRYTTPGTLIIDNRLPENRVKRSSLTYKLPANPADLDRVIAEARRPSERSSVNVVKIALLTINVVAPVGLLIYFWIRHRRKVASS